MGWERVSKKRAVELEATLERLAPGSVIGFQHYGVGGGGWIYYIGASTRPSRKYRTRGQALLAAVFAARESHTNGEQRMSTAPRHFNGGETVKVRKVRPCDSCAREIKVGEWSVRPRAGFEIPKGRMDPKLCMDCAAKHLTEVQPQKVA